MNKIRHDGIIETIDSKGHVRVRITQTSACASCKVAGHCNASESKVKVVDVFLTDTGSCPYSVGDSVVVAISQAAAGRALLLGFGLPLLLLLVVLAAMMTTGVGEGTSALVAFAVLIPYYFIVWLYRHHIAGKINFNIESN